MTRELIFISILTILCTGCVNVEAIQKLSVLEAHKNQPINMITVDCSSLGMTQYCDNYSGANKVIALKGHKMRIAANGDGTAIIMMYDKNECDLGAAACQTLASNRNYHLLKHFFKSNDVTFTSVKALANNNFIVGYLIVFDKKAYSLLN